MTSPSEVIDGSTYYSELTGRSYYSAQSRASAEQGLRRAARERLEAERRRLLGLGADPAWVERVIKDTMFAPNWPNRVLGR